MRRNIHLPCYYYKAAMGESPLTLERCAGEPLRKLIIYGNSVQDGIPSSAAAAEVMGVGDRTINLYNISATVKDDLYIPIEAGEYYQIEFPYIDRYKTIILYNENKEIVKNIIYYAYKAKGYSKWIVKPEQSGYLVVYMHELGGGIDYDAAIMITKGLTATLTTEQKTNLETNQYVRAESSSKFPEYEPCGYKIPIEVINKNGMLLKTIYISNQLKDGDEITVSEKIETLKGDCQLKVLTQVPPRRIDIQYYRF